MLQLPVDVASTVSGITELATAGIYAVTLYFLRDIYLSHKELVKTVGQHGERIVRLETLEGVEQVRNDG